MGLHAPTAVAPEDEIASVVSSRSSVAIIGPRNVGKHSMLKRNSENRISPVVCSIACL